LDIRDKPLGPVGGVLESDLAYLMVAMTLALP
jgi:hypothetical protein